MNKYSNFLESKHSSILPLKCPLPCPSHSPDQLSPREKSVTSYLGAALILSSLSGIRSLTVLNHHPRKSTQRKAILSLDPLTMFRKLVIHCMTFTYSSLKFCRSNIFLTMSAFQCFPFAKRNRMINLEVWISSPSLADRLGTTQLAEMMSWPQFWGANDLPPIERTLLARPTGL